MKIITSFVHPPIPTRANDWCAYQESKVEDGKSYGWGETEQDALADLGSKIVDRVADRLFEMAEQHLIDPEVYEECQHDIFGLSYVPW